MEQQESSTDKAFIEGDLSHYMDCPLSDNPHKKNTPEFKAWVQGWKTGKQNSANKKVLTKGAAAFLVICSLIIVDFAFYKPLQEEHEALEKQYNELCQTAKTFIYSAADTGTKNSQIRTLQAHCRFGAPLG